MPSASEIVSGGGSSNFLSGVLGTIATWGWTAAGVAATFFLVLMGAVFFALNPDVYRRGTLKLVPERYRDRVDEAMGKSADGLRLWLFGQLISMALIGSLVALGTWALGLPAPLALGIIAGIAEFVPMLGPILGAIPAVLLATTEGMNTVPWTILLFVIIQQVESNIVMPQVQREMIRIPPGPVLVLGSGFRHSVRHVRHVRRVAGGSSDSRRVRAGALGRRLTTCRELRRRNTHTAPGLTSRQQSFRGDMRRGVA